MSKRGDSVDSVDCVTSTLILAWAPIFASCLIWLTCTHFAKVARCCTCSDAKFLAQTCFFNLINFALLWSTKTCEIACSPGSPPPTYHMKSTMPPSKQSMHGVSRATHKITHARGFKIKARSLGKRANSVWRKSFGIAWENFVLLYWRKQAFWAQLLYFLIRTSEIMLLRK